MIQIMPADDSDSICVIALFINSDKTHFQNIFVTFLRRIPKQVPSLPLSGHGCFSFFLFSMSYPMKI